MMRLGVIAVCIGFSALVYINTAKHSGVLPHQAVKDRVGVPSVLYEVTSSIWLKPSGDYSHDVPQNDVDIIGTVNGVDVSSRNQGVPRRDDGFLICPDRLELTQVEAGWEYSLPWMEGDDYSVQQLQHCASIMVDAIGWAYIDIQHSKGAKSS